MLLTEESCVVSLTTDGARSLGTLRSFFDGVRGGDFSTTGDGVDAAEELACGSAARFDLERLKAPMNLNATGGWREPATGGDMAVVL